MIIQGLYAIYDKKAEDIVGNVIYLHRHEAAAVRMFADAASSPNSPVKKYPGDFCLIRLAVLKQDANEKFPTLVSAEPAEVINGETWVAAQNTEN